MVQQTVIKNTIGDPTWVQTASLLGEANSPMYITSLETTADLAVALLTHYSFDLSGYTASELVDNWKKIYPNHWLHLAVIEALYQGRYKAVSAQQILTMWQRRGHTTYHFNMEFERLICSKFPESLTAMPKPALLTASQEIQSQESKNIKSLPQVHNASTTAKPEVNKTAAYKNTIALSKNNQASFVERYVEGEAYKQKQALVTVAKPTEEDEKERLYIGASQSLPISSSRMSLEPLEELREELRPFSSSLTTKELSDKELSDKELSDKELSDKETKLLTASVNRPPIGQFSPDKSERSESFTNKLKVLVNS